MKLLLLLLVLLFAVWLWRSRRPPPRPPSRPKAVDASAQMVCCAVCGVHLPRGEAQVTPRGDYCSVEHRQQIEA